MAETGYQWVQQQAAAVAAGAQDWQGPNGADSAWNLAQTHYNWTLPVTTGSILDARDAIRRLG